MFTLALTKSLLQLIMHWYKSAQHLFFQKVSSFSFHSISFFAYAVSVLILSRKHLLLNWKYKSCISYIHCHLSYFSFTLSTINQAINVLVCGTISCRLHSQDQCKTFLAFFSWQNYQFQTGTNQINQHYFIFLIVNIWYTPKVTLTAEWFNVSQYINPSQYEAPLYSLKMFYVVWIY